MLTPRRRPVALVVALLSVLLLGGAAASARTDDDPPRVLNGDPTAFAALGDTTESVDAVTSASIGNHASPASSDAVSARIVVGSVDRPVDTFPALFGEAIWSLATDAKVRASPVIVDGTVLIGSYDGVLYALDIESALELWRVDRATAISTVTVTVSNGLVYFGDFNGQVNVVRSPADVDE